MFTWLANLFPSYTVDDLFEEIMPGHMAQMARRDQESEERDRQRHEKEVRALKKASLEQELDDAKWILDYERRLRSLQEDIAAETRRSEGRNTERLRRLNAHLDNVRNELGRT